MVRKISNITRYFFYTLIALLAFIFSDPELSGAGDLNIAEFLLSEGKIGSGFYYISPLLCDILHSFNHIWHINWWSAFSVFISFSGLFVMMWFLSKRFARMDRMAQAVLSLLFVFFFWELILKYEINFAQTSTCAAVAGVLLLGDVFYENGSGKTGIIKGTLGLVFLSLGILIRGAMIRLVLPFLLMTVLYSIVFPLPTENIVSTLKDSCWKKKARFIPCILVAVVIILGNMVGKAYDISNPDYKVWKETNGAGSAICDYTDQYPLYEDDPEVYDQIGIKGSWLNMIYDFCYSDGNTYTPETLGLMKAYRTPSTLHISDFTDMLKEHMLLWVILVAILCAVGLLYGWKTLFVPVAGAMAGFIICSLYCIYRGRIAWRATNSYVLFGLLSVLTMVSMHDVVKANEDKKSITEKRFNWIVALCLVVLIGFAAVKDEKDHISLPIAGVNNENQAKLLSEIDANDDTLYFYFDLIRFEGAYNLWKGHDPDYLDNYIPLTTCFVIGCREELESRGVYDLYRDLVTKPKMFVEYSSNTLSSFYNYLCDFYDPCMTATMTEDIIGNLYFRFSARVIPSGVQRIETLSSFTPTFINGCPDYVNDAYLVECRLGEKDSDSFDDYWVNVEDFESGRSYSYGMTCEDNKVLGTILHMSDTWSKDNCRIKLVGKNKSGSILELDDLTGVYLDTIYQEETGSEAL